MTGFAAPKFDADKSFAEVPNEFHLPPNANLRELAGAPISLMQFEPPGPVGEAYMFGTGAIDAIMGPAGSAKTTCSIFRCGAITMRMPECKDGVIRSRIAILHANFRVLYRTVLPSLFQFFPKDFPGATFEGGQDRPFCFTIRFRTPKGRMMQMILDGMGIGSHNIEELLRGYQPSGAWYPEMDLLDRKVPSFTYGRVAQERYPGKALLKDPSAPQPASTWGDLNPPKITHWINEDMIKKPRAGMKLYRQPSGLSDQAENRRFVSRESYQRMADTMAEDDVRRFVHGEFGLTGDGALVYPEFNFARHLAKAPLAPLDLPLLLGVDGGGSPALVIFQFTPKGHLRVLDEVCMKAGSGPRSLATATVDLLQAKYRGLPVRQGWGDPSAFHGADRAAGEMSFMEIVGKALGVNILPTATNDPRYRQEAVAWFLAPRPNEPEPFCQISPTCTMLVDGFQGGFVVDLNKHETSTTLRFLKNKFSHPHEALQYGAYGVRGHAGVINDAARVGRPGNIVPIRFGQPRTDFNL